MSRRFEHIAVLKGGPSAERAVSLVSGHECAVGLREAGYRVTEIDAGDDLLNHLNEARPDAVFNALHGRWGEDGCVQGILEWLRIPYTHSGVLASALAMDKEHAKTIFRAAGLPLADSILAAPADIARDHVMTPPYVVKPYNEGSSVGIHLVLTGANTPPQVAVPGAPARLMVERYIAGRELTVAVQNGEPLGVTEIFVDGWYDYDAKYKAGGSRHVIPADIPHTLARRSMDSAAKAHEALGCKGISRADFRYDPDEDALILLEVNTQPGMTPTSLVPEQAAHRGVRFADLVAWMVEDASCGR